jgi:phosphatidate cytidylyltransferase
MKATSKFSGFQQRLVTAVIFAAVMMGGIFGGAITFGVLFGIVMTLCLHEFFNLLSPANRSWIYYFGLAYGSLPYWLLFFAKWMELELSPSLVASSLLIYAVLGFSSLLAALFLTRENAFPQLGLVFLGTLYIGFSFSCLLWMGWTAEGYHRNWILGLLFFSWINDSGAYMVGSRLGRTKFFPRISPKKTWEGTVGGWIFTILLGVLLGQIFSEITPLHWVITGGIVAVLGALGDLVESMLKRQVGVKDSGTWMPGHGGALDRFDAFLFTLPYVMIYWWFFMQ